MQEPPPPQQPPPYAGDPMLQNIGWTPQPKSDLDPIMSKHLDASDMLSRLKNTLMGLEYNEDSDEWQAVKIVVGYDEDGNEVIVKGEPLLPERTIRSLIGALEVYLSPNTFLSQLMPEDKNDIMFGICQNLAVIWFRVGAKIRPEERAIIHSTIKDAIFLALSRAGNHLTLDAVSKNMQTHEIITASPNRPQQPQSKDEFKFF